MAALILEPKQGGSRALHWSLCNIASLSAVTLINIPKVGFLIWKGAKLWLKHTSVRIQAQCPCPSLKEQHLSPAEDAGKNDLVTKVEGGRESDLHLEKVCPCPGPRHRGNRLNLIFEIIQPWQLGENSGPRSKRWEGMKQGQNVIKRSQMFGSNTGSLSRFPKTRLGRPNCLLPTELLEGA